MNDLQRLAQEDLRSNMKDAIAGHYSYATTRLPVVWRYTIDRRAISMVYNELSRLSAAAIITESDDLSFDDLFGDAFDACHAETLPGGWRELEAQRKRAAQRLQDEGQWCFTAKAKVPNEHWVVVDSIGGFVGDDFIGSGYDSDLKEAAISHVLTGVGGPKWGALSPDPRDRPLLAFTVLQLAGVPILPACIDWATWNHTRS